MRSRDLPVKLAVRHLLWAEFTPADMGCEGHLTIQHTYFINSIAFFSLLDF